MNEKLRTPRCIVLINSDIHAELSKHVRYLYEAN